MASLTDIDGFGQILLQKDPEINFQKQKPPFDFTRGRFFQF